MEAPEIVVSALERDASSSEAKHYARGSLLAVRFFSFVTCTFSQLSPSKYTGPGADGSVKHIRYEQLCKLLCCFSAAPYPFAAVKSWGPACTH